MPVVAAEEEDGTAVESAPRAEESERSVPARQGLTTLTLFHFAAGQRAWAFAQMGLARPALARAPGLVFWRLLGSGQRFGLRPDFGRYGLLGVWHTRESADAFFAGPTLQRFLDRARETWTVRLSPVSSHGSWGGVNPFLVEGPRPRGEGPLAVLTRATLRPSKLRAFWRAVPEASAAIAAAEGCLLSVGIGELPLVHQATFSLWRSASHARRFAYADGVHRDIVRRTREGDWYREDLFARFDPLSSEGTLLGRDPLAGFA